MISLSTEMLGDYARVSVAGEVDFSTIERLVDKVVLALDAGARTVDVELAAVEFIDSTGIGGLLRIRARAAGQKATFRLVNCSARLRDILRLTGLDSVLTLVSEEEP